MKFTIKKLIRKEIETQYGRKWKVSALTERDEWVSSFANKYTEAWREGMNVDVETIVKGKYINCVWPKEDYRPKTQAPRIETLTDTRIDEILKLVKDIHADLWERGPKKEMDIPGHVTEDVPFDNNESQPDEEVF